MAVRSLCLWSVSPGVRASVVSPLHHGESVVTCSSEGDGLQYSCTLNGQNLTRRVAYDHYQSSVIILKSDVTGTLTCMVQNKVSSSNSTIDLSLACSGNLRTVDFIPTFWIKSTTLFHLHGQQVLCSDVFFLVVSSQFPLLAVTVSVALTVGTLTLLLALFVGINHLCKKQRSRFDTSGKMLLVI